jgi:hypothetical protein
MGALCACLRMLTAENQTIAHGNVEPSAACRELPMPDAGRGEFDRTRTMPRGTHSGDLDDHFAQGAALTDVGQRPGSSSMETVWPMKRSWLAARRVALARAAAR